MTRIENSNVEPKTRTDPANDMKDVALQVSELLMIVTLPAWMSHARTSINEAILPTSNASQNLRP
jgi:hypothetical protein